jgi:hypothetical protein
MNWSIIRDVKLVTELYYEHGILTSSPQTESTFDRFGGFISFKYQLMEKLESEVGYRYTLKDSNLAGLDYYQNGLAINLIYHF